MVGALIEDSSGRLFVHRRAVEYRWLDVDGLAILDENRAAGEDGLQLLVADALRHLQRAEPAS